MKNKEINNKLNELLSDDTESNFYNLLVLINFFISNESNLSIEEKKLIAIKCEHHRININKNTQDKLNRDEIISNIYKYYE